jgi:hypothetical protein
MGICASKADAQDSWNKSSLRSMGAAAYFEKVNMLNPSLEFMLS